MSSTCNRLDLESLGSWPTIHVPKTSWTLAMTISKATLGFCSHTQFQCDNPTPWAPNTHRNNRLKFKTSGELPIIWEESTEEYISNEHSSKIRRMSSTCNQLDSESLGSWPTTMPKNFLGTGHAYIQSDLRASPPDGVWGMPTPKMGYLGFLGGGAGINWAPPVSGPP